METVVYVELDDLTEPWPSQKKLVKESTLVDITSNQFQYQRQCTLVADVNLKECQHLRPLTVVASANLNQSQRIAA